MHKITCNTCGEPTHLPERGEVRVRELPDGKETPLDHLERTGHDPRQPPEPERRQCNDCGNVWYYQGDSGRPTCPNCKGKSTETTE